MNLFEAIDQFDITNINNINIGDYVIDLDFYHCDCSLPFFQIIQIDELRYVAEYCGQIAYLIGNVEPNTSYSEINSYYIGNDYQVVVTEKFKNYIDKTLVFS